MTGRKFRDEGLKIETKLQLERIGHIISKSLQRRIITPLRVGQSSLVSYMGNRSPKWSFKIKKRFHASQGLHFIGQKK